MSTIVYRNGGEVYLGSHSDQELSYWKWTGKQKKEKYLYKGYHYRGSEKDTVVVFDSKMWSPAELARRKANGFLGIRRYTC
jgi:hypothetical protein